MGDNAHLKGVTMSQATRARSQGLEYLLAEKDA